MFLYHYSRWDGSQQVFPLHEDDLIEQFSSHLMTHGDVSSALRSMIHRGVQGRQGQRLLGIQDLLQRLRNRRQKSLERYDLDSVLRDIQKRLQDIEHQERQGIQRRLEEVRERYLERLSLPEEAQGNEEQLLEMMERLAQQNLDFLDNLPEDPAGKVNQLRSYEFMDPDARAKFNELLKELQERVINSHMEELSQHLQGLTPQDLQGLREMLQDLNQMLEQRMQGQQPNFQQFMQRYGNLFGPNPPSTLEELIQHMQEQMAQMESLLNSMSPQVRQQLEDLMDSVLQDQELRDEMSHLAANLELLHPMSNLRQDFPFQGDESLTLDKAMELMEEFQSMAELERQLRRAQHGSNLAEVDPDLLKGILGEEAFRELEQLSQLAQLLEDAGYIRKIGDRFELTPKGMRKIGQNALREIFSYLKRDRTGTHTAHSRGWGSEPTEATKQYEHGDTFNPHLQKSLMNAFLREASSQPAETRAGGVPIRLKQQDFEIYQTEQLVQSSTVLMVDLSLSMAMRGNFVAAKKVALALDNLIRTQFPRDTLYIVGFSTYAREVKPEKLSHLTWDEFDPYTNIQQGLALAQKLLSRTSGGTKQIIMISDGEPTAHIESGQLFLQYPPSPRTIRETLREVKRCTSKGVIINTFMLDRNSHLVEFVDRMTRINRGRVFYTSPDRLGEYILADYLTSRRKLVN